MNLEQKIEGLLFWKGESMSKKKLAEIFETSESEVDLAIQNLKSSLENRGVVLQEKENEVSLGTNKEISQVLEKLQKEELNKELSKSTLETLSIILYKNGVTRAEIDYIRGVNSSFILRALSVRGLIEKVNDKDDSRRYIYKPTLELLSFMGLKSIDELPEFNDVSKSLESIVQEIEKEENEGENI